MILLESVDNMQKLWKRVWPVGGAIVWRIGREHDETDEPKASGTETQLLYLVGPQGSMARRRHHPPISSQELERDYCFLV